MEIVILPRGFQVVELLGDFLIVSVGICIWLIILRDGEPTTHLVRLVQPVLAKSVETLVLLVVGEILGITTSTTGVLAEGEPLELFFSLFRQRITLVV